MRRDAEFFDDREVSLVHIASTLRGALKLEELLTEHGVDYAVETDEYRGGFLFWSRRVGAFFYTAAEDAERTRDLMRTKKIKVHYD